MLKTKQEKERGFTNKTLKLINEIEEINLRQDYVFNLYKIEKILKEVYRICELKMPKIEVCKDITDEKFLYAARAAWAARAAGATRAARAAGIDYDFDYLVYKFEYLQHEAGNDNDKKALKLYKLFFEAKKEGLGYFAEKEGMLYICPNPVVLLDNQNRFHSEVQAAIYWKDGLEYFFLHGVNFEKEWWEKIVNDTMSPEEIFAINNLEHRRIAYEYMDKSKMKQLKDYTILDEQIDNLGKPMKIISFKVKGIDDPLKFYNCFCPSTKREYFIGTDKNTCKEAKESSFGLTNIEFVKEW